MKVAFWLNSLSLGRLFPLLPLMASICLILRWIFHFILHFDMPNPCLMLTWKTRKPRIRFGRAKTVGGCRFASRCHRRRSMRRRIYRCLRSAVTRICWLAFLWICNFTWAISAKIRNKRMRCKHGNGPRAADGKRKKGNSRFSGKGNQQSTSASFAPSTHEPDDLELLEQIRAALPQVAIIRAQSTLDQAEWNAPAVNPQLLDGRGGIALCPRNMIPEILQRAQYITIPTAILTSQPAQDFGMKGFPQQRVQRSIFVITDHGSKERVDVLRWFFHGSYGPHVAQALAAPKVDILAIRFCSAKYPARFGWPDKIGSLLQSSRNTCLKTPLLTLLAEKVKPNPFSFIKITSNVRSKLRAKLAFSTSLKSKKMSMKKKCPCYGLMSRIPWNQR